EAAREVGDEVTTPLDAPDFDIPDDFGEPAANITHAIDVSDLVGAKRAAMVAHASQIAADSWFLAMDDEQFTRAFGTEWFIRTGGTRAEGVPFLESIWA